MAISIGQLANKLNDARQKIQYELFDKINAVAQQIYRFGETVVQHLKNNQKTYWGVILGVLAAFLIYKKSTSSDNEKN